MAQIRFSNLVNDIRGASGGNTFSRARSGAIVSMRRSPRKPVFAKPGQTKVGFPAIARMWRTVSDENRREWNSLAIGVTKFNRLGFQRQPSGFELFCLATYYREQASQPFLPGPVVSQSPPLLSSSNAQYSILLNQYSHSIPTTPFYDASTLFYVTRAFPAGQQVPRSAAYHLANVSFAPRMAVAQFSGSFIPPASPLVPISEFGRFNVKMVTSLTNFNWPILVNYEQALIIPV